MKGRDMSGRLDKSTFIEHTKNISKTNRSTFKWVEDKNHLIKNLQKKIYISEKDMRQNWKIHIKFSVFKSKRLEWGWRVLVWETSKNFIQQKVTKWRKIRHKNLPKRSELLWKGETWEKIPSDDSSGRLPESRLTHYILDD